MVTLKPEEPEINPLDSLLDLLNRDQRTTITINRKSRCDGVPASSRRVDFDNLKFENPKSFESSYGFNNRNRSRNSRLPATIPRLMSRLGEVFIVGVCLLTVVRVPTVMSGPPGRHGKNTEDTLNYMHPCGKNHEKDVKNMFYKKSPKESNPEILKHIIIRTKNALDYAESFRDKYVEETFHNTFEKHHAQWANQKYDWLPSDEEIPKKLGKEVSLDYLRSKSIDESLIDSYEYLQKFAVGLEQVVADQKKLHLEFRDNFKMLDVHLIHVLCEIREAMIKRNITPRGQVPRSIMNSEIRKMEQTSYRSVRDWFIFRDLMNGLEYVIQLFSYKQENLPQSTYLSS